MTAVAAARIGVGRPVPAARIRVRAAGVMPGRANAGPTAEMGASARVPRRMPAATMAAASATVSASTTKPGERMGSTATMAAARMPAARVPFREDRRRHCQRCP